MTISIILLVLAFICKAICDVLNSRFKTSIFKNHPSLDPSISWKNKYRHGDPQQGPKFFGSTTFLVMFTDFWHLTNFFMIISFILAVTLSPFYVPIFCVVLDSFLIYVLYGIVFELLYSKFLIKK